jgi:alpha-beta hydrolase superfamily lysophospholipase
MKTTLIDFTTTDKLVLPGILFEPKNKTKKVILYLHGNGSSSVFYKQKKYRSLADKLTQKGMSLLAFNNRGANLIKHFRIINKGKEEKKNMGTSYEIIKDCIIDIDSALRFLRKQGYNEFSLLGQSSGANKICVYNYYKPRNSISRYILSAGGDDTGLYYNMFGPDKFKKMLRICRKKIKMGMGEEIIPPSDIEDMIMSYQSLYDTINPDGDYNIFPYHEIIKDIKLSKKKLLREYKSIKKPTLVIYGEIDEFCLHGVEKSVDLLRNETEGRKQFEYKIIKGADHGFWPKEDEYFNSIAKWISIQK